MDEGNRWNGRSRNTITCSCEGGEGVEGNGHGRVPIVLKAFNIASFRAGGEPWHTYRYELLQQLLASTPHGLILKRSGLNI